MKSFVRASCLAACVCTFGMALAGCEAKTEGTPVATNEDEIAAYEALVEAEQEQTEQDESDAGQ